MISTGILLIPLLVVSNYILVFHWVFKFCLLYFSFLRILFGLFVHSLNPHQRRKGAGGRGGEREIDFDLLPLVDAPTRDGALTRN